MENNTTQLHVWNNCTDQNMDDKKIMKNADSRSESYCMNNRDISRKPYRVYQTRTLDRSWFSVSLKATTGRRMW